MNQDYTEVYDLEEEKLSQACPSDQDMEIFVGISLATAGVLLALAGLAVLGFLEQPKQSGRKNPRRNEDDLEVLENINAISVPRKDNVTYLIRR
jgi:hypothetical protein